MEKYKKEVDIINNTKFVKLIFDKKPTNIDALNNIIKNEYLNEFKNDNTIPNYSVVYNDKNNDEEIIFYLNYGTDFGIYLRKDFIGLKKLYKWFIKNNKFITKINNNNDINLSDFDVLLNVQEKIDKLTNRQKNDFIFFGREKIKYTVSDDLKLLFSNTYIPRIRKIFHIEKENNKIKRVDNHYYAVFEKKSELYYNLDLIKEIEDDLIKNKIGLKLFIKGIHTISDIAVKNKNIFMTITNSKKGKNYLNYFIELIKKFNKNGVNFELIGGDENELTENIYINTDKKLLLNYNFISYVLNISDTDNFAKINKEILSNYKIRSNKFIVDLGRYNLEFIKLPNKNMFKIINIRYHDNKGQNLFETKDGIQIFENEYYMKGIINMLSNNGYGLFISPC